MYKTPRLLIIPLASITAISKNEATNALADIKSNILSSHQIVDIDITFEDIINEENFDAKIEEIDEKLKDFSGFIILHLTGGTSKIAIEILTTIRNIKPFALMAHEYYNSLPSALNTRERVLDLLNSYVPIPILFKDFSIEKIAWILHSVDLVLRRHDVFFIGKTVDIKIPPNFRLIRARSLKGFFKISESELLQLIDELKDMIIWHGEINDTQKKALAFYINLKKRILGDSALKEKRMVPLACIDCYYIMRRAKIAPCLAVSLLLKDGVIITCQRDVMSLFVMLLLKYLTRQPVWLADLISIYPEKESALFAHSCINPQFFDYEKKLEIIDHPLTGLPFVVKAHPKINTPITIVTIDPLEMKLHFFEGVIIGPQKIISKSEANQIEVKISGDILNLINNMPRGHFLLVHGSWKRDLEILSQILMQAKIMRALKGR